MLGALASLCQTSAQLRLENLAWRQQLEVLRRSTPKRERLTSADLLGLVEFRAVVYATAELVRPRFQQLRPLPWDRGWGG